MNSPIKSSRLAVFDLDGTLTRTTGVNDVAFLGALADLFSIVDVNARWHEYEHVTDAGIYLSLFREHVGREPEEMEIAMMRRGVAERLRSNVAAGEAGFAQVPGAAGMLKHLRDGSLWCAALATGGWREPAMMTLELGGIDSQLLSCAFADDHISREGIIAASIARAEKHYGIGTFDRVVCIGDAVWDVRAARRLGIPFVGVASGEKADRLRAEGAVDVIEDYLDRDAFVYLLDRAVPPSTSGAIGSR